jgi:hypothetical protein
MIFFIIIPTFHILSLNARTVHFTVQREVLTDAYQAAPVPHTGQPADR